MLAKEEEDNTRHVTCGLPSLLRHDREHDETQDASFFDFEAPAICMCRKHTLPLITCKCVCCAFSSCQQSPHMHITVLASIPE